VPAWVRYVIAFVVLSHAFIYVRIGAVLPGPIEQWTGRSRLLGGAVTGRALVTLSRIVHVVAGAVLLACAVALALNHASWRPLAIAGSAIGLAAFAIFWDGQTEFLAEEGVIGAGVSLVWLVVALLA